MIESTYTSPTRSAVVVNSPEILKERRSRRARGKEPRRTLTSVAKTKFIGSTNVLKDHVYDLGYTTSDQYTSTAIVITEYARR